MSDITREQFEAAAKKVMGSAPAGLSKDQFFQLIDMELRNPSRFSGPGMTDESGKPIEHEPGTYAGGFAKGLGDYYKPSLIKLRSALEGMTNPPQTKMDAAKMIAGTVLPTVGAIGSHTGSFLQDAAERGTQGFRTAIQDTGGLRDLATLPVRAYRNVKGSLPSEMQKVSDQMLGRGGAPHQILTPPESAPTPDLSDILGKYSSRLPFHTEPQAGGRSFPASPSPLGANVPVEGMVGEGSSAPAASLSPVASHLQPEGPRPPIETDEFPHGLVSHSFHRSIGDLNQGMRAGQPGPLDELLLRILREGK